MRATVTPIRFRTEDLHLDLIVRNDATVLYAIGKIKTGGTIEISVSFYKDATGFYTIR